MTTPEIREAVLFAVVVVTLLLLAWCGLRRPIGIVPPTVSPQGMPIEEQVRDARHRVANVEQIVTQLPDLAFRMRTVEREVSEVRAHLDGLSQGQSRIERQLQTLVDHHIAREEKA
jgi:hypothetical protein